MNDQVTTLGSAGYGVSQQQRNKVLRNTYWLLALSLLPTVLGAWVGVATGITASLNGVVGLVVFMAGAFGFMYAIEKTKHSAAGVPVLLGFTFFMGLMLSRLVGHILGFSNGSELIMTAFAGTAGVFFVMASVASVIKRDLSGMGKWLFVGILINMFVGSTVGTLFLGWVMDRLPAWALSALIYVGILLSLTALGLASDLQSMLLAGFVAGFFATGGQCVLYALAPHFYRPSIRATGVGSAVAIGRLGAMSGPLVAGKMLALGTGTAGVMLASAPGIVIAAVAMFYLSVRRNASAPD